MFITKSRLRHVFMVGTAVCSIGVMSACKSPDADRGAGTVDPSFYKTAEGAVAQSRGARFQFQTTLISFMIRSGVLADEFFLIPGTNDGVGTFNETTVLDTRFLPDETMARTTIASAYSGTASAYSGTMYDDLQKARNYASLARQALNAYAPDIPSALRGEMAAYEGFAMVMLADLYCSGIPLSILPLEGDFIYQPGSLTPQVYEKAVAVFDTAITLAGSNESIRHLASVGKGRALLALGRYTEAASSVQDVPAGYVFDLPVLFQWVVDPINGGTGVQSWTSVFTTTWNTSNREGGSEIDFRNTADRRVHPLLDSTFFYSTVRRPRQPARVKIATYIEARLIQAEALAQAGNVQYLAVLNDLRANGDVAGLGPLTEPTVDPGETVLNARVDLIFEERAMWLFFTGHRQGDLRRLIRHYDRLVEDTYPTGAHPTGPGYYSDYVDIPIPIQELPNPLFTGCAARGE